MTAPVLVLVSQGSADPRVNSTMHSFRKRLQEHRPDLSINVAFLEHCPPTGPQVVTTLANRGVTEIVFVPLSLTAAIEAPGIDDLVRRTRAAHPNLRIAAARPLGPSSDLLTLLDEQLRAALRAVQANQLDALVLAAPNGGDRRGTALMQRRARQWAAHHKLTCHLAVNDVSGQGTAEAVAALRAHGRRHIAVGSLWLSEDDAFVAHAKAAIERGAIAVSRPFGVQDRLLEVAIDRYAYAAIALLEDEVVESAQVAL